MYCNRLFAVGVVALFANGPVMANKVTELDLHPPNDLSIKVESTDGSIYDKVVSTGPLVFRLDADCRYDQKAGFQEHDLNELAFSAPGLAVDLESPFMVATGKQYVASYWVKTPLNYRQITLNTKYIGQASGEFADPIQACNDELARRVFNNQGTPREEFLAKGFAVKAPEGGRLNVQLICHPLSKKAGFTDFHDQTERFDLQVDCLPSAKAKPKPKPPETKKAQLVPAVKAIKLELNPTRYQGVCPATVKVDATITLNYPAEIKYQYIGDKGHQSPVFTLGNKGEAGSWNLAPWTRRIEPPNTQGNLAVGPGKGDYLHNGWMKVKLLSPKPMSSEAAEFKFRCLRTPPKGPSNLRQPKPAPEPTAPGLRSEPAGPLPAGKREPRQIGVVGSKVDQQATGEKTTIISPVVPAPAAD